MHLLTAVVLRSGIVPEEKIAEMKKWGLIEESQESSYPPPEDAKQLIQQLDQALQDEDMVLIRETELESLSSYLSSQQVGMLYLFDPETEVGTEVQVVYGRTKIGEYVLPWSSESIEIMLTNGSTHLVTAQDERVFFSTVRELFFGQQKSFVVCSASQREVSNGTQAPPDQLPG